MCTKYTKDLLWSSSRRHFKRSEATTVKGCFARDMLFLKRMPKELNQIVFDFSADTPKQEQETPRSSSAPSKTRGRKSVKETTEIMEMVEIPDDEVLFQKQYYSIGEVAQMFHVNVSLIRYWEGEFNLKLRKNRKGDRFFTPKDVKTLQLIHDLIRRRKFTLEGARDFLKNAKGADEKYAMIQSLQRIRSFLLELKAHL